MLSLNPKGKGVCTACIHLSSVSCLKMFFHLAVEFESKNISSTGCTIFLSGDHTFPVRAKCLYRKVSIYSVFLCVFSFYQKLLKSFFKFMFSLANIVHTSTSFHLMSQITS